MSTERGWRLRLGFQRILFSGRILPRIRESVVGHYTWLALLRRPALCIFDKAYAFIRGGGDEPRSLPGAARREIETAIGLLPLLVCDWKATWCDNVLATDASETGYGICQRKLPITQIRQIA